MKKLAFGVFLAFLGFVPAVLSAQAFSINPTRWDHSCFTHAADPRLTTALAQWAAVSGVTDCGLSLDPDVKLQVVPDGSFPGSQVGAAECSARPVPNGDNWDYLYTVCTIKLTKAYSERPAVILHEMGHVLGLGHSQDKTAVMFESTSANSPTTPQPDDIAAIRALYGPKRTPSSLQYQLLVPIVSR